MDSVVGRYSSEVLSRLTWHTAITFLTITPILWILYRWIYNIWFHPLAKYPGPFWARSTGWWQTIQNFKMRQSRLVLAAHERWGPVVRVAPNELAFQNPSAAAAIYNANKNIIKSDFYEGTHFFSGAWNIFAIRHPQMHAARRKLFSHAFAQTSMLEFMPQLDIKISDFLNAVEREMKSNGEADFLELSNWLGFEIIRMLKTGAEHPILAKIHNTTFAFLFNQLYHLDPEKGTGLPSIIGKSYRDLVDFANFGVHVIHEYRATGVATPFLRRITEKADEYLGRPLNDREILEESLGLMFAGSGTTANTLVYLFWELSRNPQIQEKLAAELKAAGEHANEHTYLSYETVKNLPYLKAVVKEAMRLWPTIPGNRPRLTMADTVVDGHYIPAGTVLGMRNYVTHRTESIFPEANSFKPERWLSATAEQNNAEIGFGSGNRACIGRHLAMMELLSTTANLANTFELSNPKNVTEDDMWLTDTFNGVPKCSSVRLGVRKRF